MKYIIYFLLISMFFAACNQQVDNEAKTEKAELKEAINVSEAKDTVIGTVQQIQVIEQPNKTETFNPEKLVGKYRMWNKDNNCYAIAEISKESNQYNAGFYLECEEQAGFSDIAEIKENTLYMKPEGDYNGCSIWLDKNKLAVKWIGDNTIEYYSKF